MIVTDPSCARAQADQLQSDLLKAEERAHDAQQQVRASITRPPYGYRTATSPPNVGRTAASCSLSYAVAML